MHERGAGGNPPQKNPHAREEALEQRDEMWLSEQAVKGAFHQKEKIII